MPGASARRGAGVEAIKRSLTWARSGQYIIERYHVLEHGMLGEGLQAPVPYSRFWPGVPLMCSRTSALVLSLTSLCTGILLGIVLARGGPAVSAQVAAASRPEAKAAAGLPAG